MNEHARPQKRFTSRQMMKKIIKKTIDGKDKTGLISDGYHTFDELYDHRITLFIALAKRFAVARNHQVWRAKKHSDGSSFKGWFIMGIGKEPGKQITYHLPLKEWKNTYFAKELFSAPKWDGHTPEDVLRRLKNL